jgi:MFS family permease
MTTGKGPADRLKPRHGFIADDQGRLIYIPPIGGPRVVPSKEDALRFARDANRCFLVALALWACAAAALVLLQDWPIKRPFEWLTLVFVARIVCASVLARRWQSASGGTVNFAPVAAAALSGQGRGILVGKLLLYGLITLVCAAGAVAAAFVLQSSWATLEPWTRGRAIMLLVLMILLAPLFATNTHRVLLALRHRGRSRPRAAVQRR